MRTVLLIDMSGSILESDTLDAIKTSARYFITSITAEGGTEIAIYLFDGRETITEQVAFTADNSTLLSALDTLTRETILSDPAYDISTNLNGAVQQGLKALDSACAATASSQICMGSLVTFTDGTDQAARIADSAAVESVTAADHASLTLGLGGEIDEAHLLALGKDGFAWAESSGDLEAAFKKVANDIRNKH
ncbi:MAG: VWA domain-containing protein, partial [Deltaproteobacteria bacterium]|nr:VWA domain-containing protein [Deltaproteobacteria bacterium]